MSAPGRFKAAPERRASDEVSFEKQQSMRSRASRALVVGIAAFFAAVALAAAPPIRITTTPLTATGTGEREKTFSLKLTTAALTATGMAGREEPFRPVVIRTEPLTATGLAKPASPVGGKK
jgi:hypothetical protein